MSGNDGFRGDPATNEDKKPTRNMDEPTSSYGGTVDTNQQNVDTYNDANEPYMYSAGDNRDDNNHRIIPDSNTNSNSNSNSKKRGKVICHDFQKGLCRRRNCRVIREFSLASIQLTLNI